MAEVVTSFTPEQGGSLSIPEPGTPQFSSFVGTDGPELRAVRLLPERTAPALVLPIRPDKRRRTISDGQYAAARVGVDFVCTCIALVTALICGPDSRRGRLWLPGDHDGHHCPGRHKPTRR